MQKLKILWERRGVSHPLFVKSCLPDSKCEFSSTCVTLTSLFVVWMTWLPLLFMLKVCHDSRGFVCAHFMASHMGPMCWYVSLPVKGRQSVCLPPCTCDYMFCISGQSWELEVMESCFSMPIGFRKKAAVSSQFQHSEFPNFIAPTPTLQLFHAALPHCVSLPA